MKLFSTLALGGVIILGVSSCMKKENYPIIPAITFKSLTVNSGDTAILQVTFTDGDGDIGYQSTNPPFDFFVEWLYDSSGHFEPILAPGTLSDSRMGDTAFTGYNVPYITPDGNNKELSGQIQVLMPPGGYYVADHVNMKYKVWLVDRAGHVSNTVITPIIVSP